MSSIKDDKDVQKEYAQELGETGEQRPELSPEDDKRIQRKIDIILLPLMAVSYLFQFLDKSALSFTAILNLNEDLNLTGLDFSWANSIYYFGYLGASYPMGMLLVRFPVAKLMAVSILIWGGIMMLASTCFNAGGLLANRFFLGATEAGIGPGLTVVVAMWYKRSEQPLRMGAWYLGNTIAGITGGLMGYGIGRIDTIAPWKAVFLVFGAATVAWSVVIFFLLPDTQQNARWLSKEDRQKAIDRVKENMTGIKSNEWKRYQTIEAFLDIKVWLIVITQTAQQVANGGIHGFGSIIIRGMGFSTFNTLLIQSIAYVFQGVFVLIASVGSTYIPNSRTYFMAWNLLISLAGSTMIRQVPEDQIWTRFMGYCLSLGYSANFPLVLSLSSGNMAGFTKKTTVNAMIFIAYCVGNIIGPQLFLESESPGYTTGFLSMMICFAIGIVCCFLLRFYLIWENRRRDKTTPVTEEDLQDPNLVLVDETDKKMPKFRYCY